jgi:hypothetical protein
MPGLIGVLIAVAVMLVVLYVGLMVFTDEHRK